MIRNKKSHAPSLGRRAAPGHYRDLPLHQAFGRLFFLSRSLDGDALENRLAILITVSALLAGFAISAGTAISAEDLSEAVELDIGRYGENGTYRPGALNRLNARLGPWFHSKFADEFTQEELTDEIYREARTTLLSSMISISTMVILILEMIVVSICVLLQYFHSSDVLVSSGDAFRAFWKTVMNLAFHLMLVTSLIGNVFFFLLIAATLEVKFPRCAGHSTVDPIDKGPLDILEVHPEDCILESSVKAFFGVTVPIVFLIAVGHIFLSIRYGAYPEAPEQKPETPQQQELQAKPRQPLSDFPDGEEE
eukprot:m.27873 g.27873  ORF g.27873 m.27873 type:complete len:308 (-) comp14025_c0_seq2:94-1017(-)